MLLENGDLLVPAEEGTEMVRLRPGDEGHADWLAYVQSQRPREPVAREPSRREPAPPRERAPSSGRRAGGCGLGLLVGILLVLILIVVAVLAILSLVSDLQLPDLPDIPGLPEDAPGGGQ